MKARPTRYKGTLMRSRFEAAYAAWLDKHRFDWEYEPECFADETGQYLPDFLIRNVMRTDSVSGPGLPYELYVELKPPSFMAEPGADERWAKLQRQMMVIPNRMDRMVVVTGCFDEDGLIVMNARYGTTMTWTFGFLEPPALTPLLPKDSGPFAGEYWKVQ